MKRVSLLQKAYRRLLAAMQLGSRLSATAHGNATNGQYASPKPQAVWVVIP